MAHLTKAQKLDVLRASPVFADADAHVLESLAEVMQTERFAAGEVVFEFGEEADRVLIVAEGALSVFLPEGAAAVRTLRRGETIGEYGMVIGGGRTSTVTADETSAVLSLDYQRFEVFLTRYPSALFCLFETAVWRLIALEKRVRGDG